MDENAYTLLEGPAAEPYQPALGLEGASNGSDTSEPAGEGSARQASPVRDGASAEEPIGYRLTARARRAVAPGTLPPLEVVPDDRSERPGDTRPARARALRRAGTPIDRIAFQLDADELDVRVWVADIGRSDRSVAPRRPKPRQLRAAPRPAGWTGRDDPVDETAVGLTRARAAEDARPRLRDDAAFAAGVGYLSAMATVDAHAVSLTLERPEQAAFVIGWLRRTAMVAPRAIRVVLRVPAGAAADLLRHRWATALDLPVEQVGSAVWRAAPDTTAVEAIVRVADPAAAAAIGGWCDALLEPAPEVEAAF